MAERTNVEASDREHELRADNALRCAWLRVHSDRLRATDPGGQLSAQLFDFADLLEVAEREGF